MKLNEDNKKVIYKKTSLLDYIIIKFLIKWLIQVCIKSIPKIYIQGKYIFIKKKWLSLNNICTIISYSVYTISVFLILCFCSLFIYIIYVNNLLKERDSSKRQKRRVS